MIFARRFHGWYVCLLVLIVTLGIILTRSMVRAATLEEIEKQINDLQNQLQLSVSATTPLESEVSKLNKQVESIQFQISEAEIKTQELAASIKTREGEIKVQYVVLATKVRDYYKKSRLFSPWLVLASAQSASELTRGLAYKAVSTNEDKNLIVGITRDIIGLEDDKKLIEESKIKLASLQTKLDTQKAFFEKEITGAKKWQAELSGKIAALSVKQQQLIAEKFGSLNLPTSMGGGNLLCTDDRNIDPGFSNAFAFYTYGIPHRVGMSQYGAYGRAKFENQTYDQILRAYYNFDEYQDRGGSIMVNDCQGKNCIGKGSVVWSGSLEEYMNRIYEVPASWPIEALMAQAIATRSYVLAVTNNGSQSICATQYCQVFNDKPKDGAWGQAISNTSGKVMLSGGTVITAWYASTAGGYTFTNSDIWGGSQRSWTKRLRDTNGDVSNWNDLLSKAYDRESPCMYAAQGWRSEYGKSAWLKASEVADIVNVLMLAKKDPSIQTHLSQIDKPNPDGVETWDAEKVKSELKARGGNPLETVSNISVSVDFGIGKTSNISIDGLSFSANEFIDYFNLRAPANIQIVGPLFNIERK